MSSLWDSASQTTEADNDTDTQTQSSCTCTSNITLGLWNGYVEGLQHTYQELQLSSLPYGALPLGVGQRTAPVQPSSSGMPHSVLPANVKHKHAVNKDQLSCVAKNTQFHVLYLDQCTSPGFIASAVEALCARCTLLHSLLSFLSSLPVSPAPSGSTLHWQALCQPETTVQCNSSGLLQSHSKPLFSEN